MKGNAARWWLVLGILAVGYSVVAFALPFVRGGVFWVSYLFALIALGVQIYVVRTAFLRGEGERSKFYGFPIARLGVLYLAVQLVVSLVCMAAGAVLPGWLPLVIDVVLLGAAGIGLIAADAAREEVERQENRQVRDTALMYSLRVRVDALAGRGGSPEADRALSALAEAFRFSDPVSAPMLAQMEEELTAQVAALEETAGQGERVVCLCEALTAGLQRRNQMCRESKRRG